MTDKLPTLTPAALAVIRNASDAELEQERQRTAKLEGPAAAAAHLAVMDEQERREELAKVAPIAGRTGHANGVRFERRDDSIVEAVRRKRAEQAACEERAFHAIAHVRNA